VSGDRAAGVSYAPVLLYMYDTERRAISLRQQTELYVVSVRHKYSRRLNADNAGRQMTQRRIPAGAPGDGSATVCECHVRVEPAPAAR